MRKRHKEITEKVGKKKYKKSFEEGFE